MQDDDFSIFWRNDVHAQGLFYDLLARSEQDAYNDDFLARLAAYREADGDAAHADIFAAQYLLAHGEGDEGAGTLGCTAAVGGGMVRDLILGQTPPIMFLQPIYTEVAFVTSILYFVFEKRTHRQSGEHVTNLLYIADSVGLGVFVVVGSLAAFRAGYGSSLFLCTFVGVLTGIGGGLLRDMLSAELPIIMRKRVYGLAAIFGALSFSLLMEWHYEEEVAIFSGVSITALIRFLAIYYHWNLPSFKEE